MAGSINKVILVGRLGQDPKLTYMPSGSPVAEMSVATDESYKDREGNKVDRVEWHRVKVFGKSAEFCGNYLAKGRLVYVEGTLRTRSWEDQQGQKRYMTEVVVTGPGHTIQGLDSRGGMAAEAPMGDEGFQGRRSYQGGGQGGGGQGGAPRGGQQNAPRGGQNGTRGNQPYPDEEPGPAFPSEASGMDDVPF
ncbi:single-stranded DNA-binding protein [Solidesulfovibrio sp.]|mgnify:CR=1 FL=1|uniref:single-stranded DNA-binding protein n=1 Tax=Solidesulfovibrio sp. TaxID=2910990 RepID=UPI002B1F84E0|nr:single-stranded DNA-binding protein [Solidesulfovibrio sp.]MEA5089785.1 single-stranded DNA-binding protein [Solidesulfovibrio sp.]HML62166.1 single-stranded DNA-binding protein [Solidesulfovibrio sp.]